MYRLILFDLTTLPQQFPGLIIFIGPHTPIHAWHQFPALTNKASLFQQI